MNLFKSILLLLSLSCLLYSCGGSSSDDDFVGAAKVEISVSPDRIDSGDRLRVEIRIESVHEDGIIVKVNFPEALEYVRDSAELEVLGEEIDFSPLVNAIGEDGVFLVFFIPFDDIFDAFADGTLSFELEALEEIKDAEIAVDADVDDPLIPNQNEFDIDSPEFGAEDSEIINVTS